MAKGALLKHIYNKFVRPHLPYKIGVYNGISVRGTVRELDFTDEFPNYKEANISALRESVRRKDDVVVIGGGLGVTTVIAAFEAGTDGSVTVYEASNDEIQTIERTLDINKVDDICTIQHAVVGPAVDIKGNMGDASVVEPSRLPECDVLEIDAEGAEKEIIPNLSIRSRVIIVETHPKFDSTTEDIRRELDQAGYRVETKVADPTDGDILTAKLAD
jgi:hypothetical protein